MSCSIQLRTLTDNEYLAVCHREISWLAKTHALLAAQFVPTEGGQIVSGYILPASDTVYTPTSISCFMMWLFF